MDKAAISLLIFVCAYILFIFLSKRRTFVAISASILLLLDKNLTLKEAFFRINWNVMGIFFGMLAACLRKKAIR